MDLWFTFFFLIKKKVLRIKLIFNRKFKMKIVKQIFFTSPVHGFYEHIFFFYSYNSYLGNKFDNITINNGVSVI